MLTNQNKAKLLLFKNQFKLLSFPNLVHKSNLDNFVLENQNLFYI